MPKYEFQVCIHMLLYLRADKQYWYRGPRTLPWEVIMPFITKINGLRLLLMIVSFMVLDKTMWGWRPKTFVTSGFPNISHKPRKLADLGAKAHSAVEAITGTMVFQDPVAYLTQYGHTT